MLITLIAGARPNFMKVAPIISEIERKKAQGIPIDYRLVHTGQHYDQNMSGSFFLELGIPPPHINLECGSGSQAEQTANIMIAFEKDLNNNPSDLVMVVGDVNSTLACSIVAKKNGTRVAHVEGGIRSFDVTMPEEINRMVTDAITDYFFTTSTFANENLLNAGVRESQIYFVGNVMIDTLLKNIKRVKRPDLWDHLGLKEKEYFVLTMHRPANVDKEEKLRQFLTEIAGNVNGWPVIFPVHPRTSKVISGLGVKLSNLHLVNPLGYLEFNFLVQNAKAVITDSGGITEETTVLGIPCLTLRENTERPETVDVGTNELIGTNPKNIKPALQKILAGAWKTGTIPKYWDGQSAKRIVDVLIKLDHR